MVYEESSGLVRRGFRSDDRIRRLESILAMVRTEPRITAAKLGQQLGLPRQHVSRLLWMLKADGQVDNRRWHWSPVASVPPWQIASPEQARPRRRVSLDRLVQKLAALQRQTPSMEVSLVVLVKDDPPIRDTR